MSMRLLVLGLMAGASVFGVTPALARVAAPPLNGYHSGSASAGAAHEFSDDPTGRAVVVGFRIKG